MSLKDPPGAFEGATPKKAGSEKKFLKKKQSFYLRSANLSHMNSQLPARGKLMLAIYGLMAIPVCAWAYNTDRNGTRGRK